MIYFLLFRIAPRSPLGLWAFRKWSGVLTISKHFKRGNWERVRVWGRWIVDSKGNLINSVINHMTEPSWSPISISIDGKMGRLGVRDDGVVVWKETK